jgi:hypothetical protein
MGAAVDFENESLRRLIVNGCYWAVGLENAILSKADVGFVDDYQPTWFGFGKYKKGMKPEEFELNRKK